MCSIYGFLLMPEACPTDLSAAETQLPAKNVIKMKKLLGSKLICLFIFIVKETQIFVRFKEIIQVA